MLSPNRKVGGFFCAKGHIKDRFVCYDNDNNFKDMERFDMSYKILLVEDNPQIRMGINDFFVGKSAGELEIIHAEDGDEGLGKIYENEYDLILLDIMLPGIDGYTICKEIRKKSTVPIIFITAKIHEEDMLHGYDMGCDDYITKPFSLKELYAKVQALGDNGKYLKTVVSKGYIITEGK